MLQVQQYGPWAVIAGGSEGVGAEFAAQLAQAGLNLVLIARKPGPLHATAARCRDLGAPRYANLPSTSPPRMASTRSSVPQTIWR